MCGSHPCDCHNQARVIMEANATDKTITIWGPVSVEMPSADKPIPKLIRLEAIRQALPQILKRGRFSVRHHDQIVGEIQPILKPDPDRIPQAHPELRRMVESVVKEHGGLPTGILTVTEAIANVFPRLKPIVGQEAAFAGGVVYGDNETAKRVQQDVREGKLDSYSISGTTFQTNVSEWCDPARGCYEVEEVKQMDGSAITIGSSRGGTGSPFDAKTMNHGAAFVVVEQAQANLTTTTPGTSNPRTDPDSLTQPIRARGLEFQDFDACVAWAKTNGLNDPQAWCGALKSETQGGGNGQPLKQTTQVGVPETIMPGKDESPKTEPKPTEQATPQAKPEAAPAKVEQQAPPATDANTVLAEVMRRLEDLEKKVAAMMAPAAPPAAPEPAPEAQAAPAKPVTMDDVKQAIQEALKPKTEAKPVQQAKPARIVQTPEPATPGATGNSKDELREILQAIDNGNPVAVKDFISTLRSRKA